MKQSFFTGLVIVLPFAITIWFMYIFVKVVTAPFVTGVSLFLHKIEIVSSRVWIFSANQIIQGIAIVGILIGLFTLLFCIGLVSRLLCLHIFVQGAEKLVAKIPFVSKVYTVCRECTNIVFAPQKKSFSKVVWIPFPTPRQGLLGFVTNNVTIKTFEGRQKKFLAVFSPGTPNPTNGFLLLCPETCIFSTNLNVEESMQWIVSCGVSKPKGFAKASSDLAQKK